MPARGAAFAGARVESLPLLEENGFLPDLDAVEDWDRIALFWVNYPNNPTGALASLSFFERLRELAREHDFLLCSDEAYSELWFTEPPCSALQVADRSNVVVFQTLSKRSSMTGYRSGFVGGVAGVDFGAEDLPALDGRGPAGVRPARVGGRVERRGARLAHARCIPAQARRVPAGARAEGLARRGERGDDVPLGRGAGR